MYRPAYVWRRQLSSDQMAKLDAIGKMRRRFLSPELVARCRFARCQVKDTRKWYDVYETADGRWDGVPVTFDFVIRPLFMEYANVVYGQTLADALEYYPHFMRHDVIDGSLAGERCVIFPDRLDEAAAYWMQARAWYVMDHTDIAVGESCRVTVDPQTPRRGERVSATVHLVLDRPAAMKDTRDEVAAIMASGKAFPIDSTARKCEPKLTAEMFAELSLPELALLNWDQVRKPLTAADFRLHQAIERFDYEGVRAALENGADPNCSPDKDLTETPLTTVCSYKHWERQTSGRTDWDELRATFPGPRPTEIIRMIDLLVAAGAAVDWAPPEGLTPLAEAALSSDAAVVKHLLDLGADPSIRCYNDEGEQAWGSAWDFAHYRNSPHGCDDDPSAWEALVAKWPEPYGGFE